MLQKLVKNILIIIGVLTICVFIVKGINSMIFKLRNIKYTVTFWEGEWSSTKYPFISGKMIAMLPNKLPKDTTINVRMEVYYNIWGFYNMGKCKEFTLSGYLDEYGSTNGLSDRTQQDKNSNTIKSSSFSFKAKATNSSGQEIEYTGVVNADRTMIVGGYISSYPYDVGSFIIGNF